MPRTFNINPDITFPRPIHRNANLLRRRRVKHIPREPIPRTRRIGIIQAAVIIHICPQTAGRIARMELRAGPPRCSYRAPSRIVRWMTRMANRCRRPRLDQVASCERIERFPLVLRRPAYAIRNGLARRLLWANGSSTLRACNSDCEEHVEDGSRQHGPLRC
jgi:hypothetical protein